MNTRHIRGGLIAAMGMLGLLATSSVFAADWTVGISDASASWNSVYEQGFSPSVAPNPDPSLAAGTTVYLNQFQFFKSGQPDNISNIQLAILNNNFGDL